MGQEKKSPLVIFCKEPTAKGDGKRGRWMPGEKLTFDADDKEIVKGYQLLATGRFTKSEKEGQAAKKAYEKRQKLNLDKIEARKVLAARVLEAGNAKGTGKGGVSAAELKAVNERLEALEAENSELKEQLAAGAAKK